MSIYFTNSNQNGPRDNKTINTGLTVEITWKRFQCFFLYSRTYKHRIKTAKKFDGATPNDTNCNLSKQHLIHMKPIIWMEFHLWRRIQNYKTIHQKAFTATTNDQDGEEMYSFLKPENPKNAAKCTPIHNRTDYKFVWSNLKRWTIKPSRRYNHAKSSHGT